MPDSRIHVSNPFGYSLTETQLDRAVARHLDTNGFLRSAETYTEAEHHADGSATVTVHHVIPAGASTEITITATAAEVLREAELKRSFEAEANRERKYRQRAESRLHDIRDANVDAGAYLTLLHKIAALHRGATCPQCNVPAPCPTLKALTNLSGPR